MVKLTSDRTGNFRVKSVKDDRDFVSKEGPRRSRDADQPLLSTTIASDDIFRDGLRYKQTGELVTTTTVLTTDRFERGMRISAKGELVTAADVGQRRRIENGLPVDDNGALLTS